MYSSADKIVESVPGDGVRQIAYNGREVEDNSIVQTVKVTDAQNKPPLTGLYQEWVMSTPSTSSITEIRAMKAPKTAQNCCGRHSFKSGD